MVSVGQAPKDRKPAPAMFYMYVADCDADYAQAVQAGGKSIRPPGDQFYGDRSGAVEDPIGNQWYIATHKEILSDAEVVARALARKGNR